MNTQQLIEAVAKNQKGLSKAQVKSVISNVLSTVQTAVKKGDDVRLVGFGTFTKGKRKARTGRNPQTGASIKIPATKFPKFRPGAEFKAAVK